MHSVVVETARAAHIVDERIVEIVNDSGEGAQTCGQMFADLCAKNGNRISTVGIIPAEIEPPSRSRAPASADRTRLEGATQAIHRVIAILRQG
jgi:hypothetical protein